MTQRWDDRLVTLLLAVASISCCATAAAAAPISSRPNVVLIMSDDQGYGDFGVMGNEVIQTPRIDALAKNSASMGTFYVSPVCSPTRASLLTGRYNYRTRCIDTWIGRSMMEPEEVTIAELLSAAGYRTGVFGKWHLGDCYPMRPNDQGFDEALVHRGGGLAQPSEPRENQRRYTDPILFRNGEQVTTAGYCTDVYFNAARNFIKQSVAQDRNFFAYIPTNAPHDPFDDVPAALREEYLEKKDALRRLVSEGGNTEKKIDTLARIYAMITNIDENVGRLMEELKALGVADNTLVIYLNDNGPTRVRAAGPFRGHKGSVYEGGIRTPLWLHWPARFASGMTSEALAAHIDLMPTILEACQVELPVALNIDGRSLLPALEQNQSWDDRSIVIQSHRGDRPSRYNHCMVRQGSWKLVHATGFDQHQFDGEPSFELYNLDQDIAESNDVADEHLDVVARMRQIYEAWYDDVSSTRPDNYTPPRIIIGSQQEPVTTLTRQDWRASGWSDDQIGSWFVHVARAGDFAFACEVAEVVERDRQVILEISGETFTAPLPANELRVVVSDVPLATGPAELKVSVKIDNDLRGIYQIRVRPTL